MSNLSLDSVAEASDISIGEVSNLEKLQAVYNKNYTILAPKSITANDIAVTLTNNGQEKGIWGAIHFSYDGKEIGKANIYYDEESELAAIVTEDNSTKAKAVSKIPFILTGIIIVLILFILYLLVSIIKRR